MRGGLETRLRERDGFQLIEVVVVVLVLAILIAIAIPSYRALEARSQTAAAKSNVRSALPVVEAYYMDHQNYAFDTRADGTPATGVEDALRTYDGGLVFSGSHAVAVSSADGGASYCLSAEGAGGDFWKKEGPGAGVTISDTGC